MPKPSHDAVEEAIRSLTGLDYSPNVASTIEALLVSWRASARGAPRTIAAVNDIVDELFGVLPGEERGRLSPFRREGAKPLWQVSDESGRKTVWNTATRQRAKVLFEPYSDGDRDFRGGLRSDAPHVLLEQLPTRTVELPEGGREALKLRPGWQALAVVLLRNQEFEDPPTFDDLREGLREFLSVDDATIDTVLDDTPLITDPAGAPEWAPSNLADDLRPGPVAQPATVTLQPQGSRQAESDLVVIEERTRRMLRLALRSYSAVLLVGPPGTGKGVILQEMVREIRETPTALGFVRTDIPEPVTATPDESWTAFELLGGLAPAADGELHFAPGLVLDAIKDDRWLILDETNRGDMDKIFGALLTWLADQEVQVGKTSPGEEGRAIRLGWTESAESAVDPVGGVASTSALEPGEAVRYLAGREWRLLGTYNPQDAQRVFRFGQALSRRFVTVPIPALSEADFATLLDAVAADLPEQARFCIRGLYGAHLGSDRTSLGPAVFMRMPKYIRHGLLAASKGASGCSEAEADIDQQPQEVAAEEASPEGDEPPAATATGAQSTTVIADDLLSQLLSEAYVLSVGKYLSSLSDAEFDRLGQRVTTERRLLPEPEWAWVGQRRKEIA